MKTPTGRCSAAWFLKPTLIWEKLDRILGAGKSILCEEDAYLKELVRYIHLNPLRAEIVKDLTALDKYPYTGHSAIMGRKPNTWQDGENIQRCKSGADLLYVEGDATDDENLVAAGIENAAGIIITLPSDKDTLYVTMTARMLNKKVRIVSRMINQKLLPKLKMAGANSVVSPNTIGALRMASEMIRPTVVDFLDRMLRSKQGNLRIHQIAVQENSSIAGKNLHESELKAKFNLLILAVRHDNGGIKFNPPASQVLTAGMTLITMGDVDDIARAKKAF